MSVEIKFPLEFIVAGTPVSMQAKRPASKQAWMNQVRTTSSTVLPHGHFATEASISVTLLYFPEGNMAGDIDNIVKPILDALCKHIYMDDRQVERIWVQKFEPGRTFRIADPSVTLQRALTGQRPLLYIRIGADQTEGLA